MRKGFLLWTAADLDPPVVIVSRLDCGDGALSQPQVCTHSGGGSRRSTVQMSAARQGVHSLTVSEWTLTVSEWTP